MAESPQSDDMGRANGGRFAGCGLVGGCVSGAARRRMFAVERRFLDGETQRLPMSSCDDTDGQQRLAEQRGERSRAC